MRASAAGKYISALASALATPIASNLLFDGGDSRDEERLVATMLIPPFVSLGM
jgi:hypothetical protein